MENFFALLGRKQRLVPESGSGKTMKLDAYPFFSRGYTRALRAGSPTPMVKVAPY